MRTSTKLRETSLRTTDGLVRAVEYDVVGPVRIMEHLVLVEIGRIFSGSQASPDTVPPDVRAQLVNPRGP